VVYSLHMQPLLVLHMARAYRSRLHAHASSVEPPHWVGLGWASGTEVVQHLVLEVLQCRVARHRFGKLTAGDQVL
jgi:hypothetical protein